MNDQPGQLEVLIIAVPETAGSALYGMVDVLAAAGNLWQALSGREQRHLLKPKIVSENPTPFTCGNRIPVQPELSIDTVSRADIIVLPELWLAPDEDISGRFPALMDWIRRMHSQGSYIYSACSGSIMLAESGLLNGCEATSHWGYQDLFRRKYPAVNFKSEPNLAFADPEGRIVTAGGTTSWHDLAIHIISRHCNPGEAMRIAKAYLLKWHGEGQLPYANLVRRLPHEDAMVRNCENWLAENFARPGCLRKAVAFSGVPERTLKRRFTNATGMSPITYIQNLRIEEAKRILENEKTPVEEIAPRVGYEEPASFRRLFKRSTGMTMGQYRDLFRPLRQSGKPAVAN